MYAKNPFLELQMKLLSSKSTALTPYFGRHKYKKHKPAKVGMKSCQRMYLMCACMDVTTQPELCLHEQTQIVANAACIVDDQKFLCQIASYLFPYFHCNPYFLFKFLYIMYCIPCRFRRPCSKKGAIRYEIEMILSQGLLDTCSFPYAIQKLLLLSMLIVFVKILYGCILAQLHIQNKT